MNPDAYLEMAAVEDRHWWFVGRRQILSNFLSTLDLDPQSSIIEVGCGTGGNLGMLAEFGRVHAIEMDPNARAIAIRKTNGQCDIRAGSCPNDIGFGEERFDLICMFDVLEHVEQDVETLIALRHHLKNDGRILLTVPAYQWLYGPHDNFLHHKRRYSARGLREKVLKAGLSPIRMSYFNTLLFPFAAIARLKDKIFKNSKASGQAVPSKMINSVLRATFAAETVLLKTTNLPYGVSILCLLKAAGSEEKAPSR